MTASFYDLIQPGMTQKLGCHTFTRDEIIKFATEFDPQLFHLNEASAETSVFGKLCASGWHTVSVWMRLNVLHGRGELLRLTGYEGDGPTFGPSPGVRNIKWLLPVFVGDTISYESTLTAKKPSKRDGWALLTNHSTGLNQHNEPVLTMNGAVTLRMD